MVMITTEVTLMRGITNMSTPTQGLGLTTNTHCFLIQELLTG